MDKTNRWSSDPFVESMRPTPELSDSLSNSMVRIKDPRVAQLLLVLHEIDESMAGLEKLPKSELGELVSGAILACGFVDPVEARCAIAAILDAIEMDVSMPEETPELG